MRSLFRRPLLFSVVYVPLTTFQGWHALTFSGRNVNEWSPTPGGMRISVQNSSSALFFPLEKPEAFRSVLVKGQILALPRLKPNETEGPGGMDDFVLRLGVVYAGENRLSWLERLFAPAWLKRMQDLYPDRGIRKVHFYNVTQKSPAGTPLASPKEALLQSESALQVTGAGPFEFARPLSTPGNVLGVWLQSDGDDSKSSFELVVASIRLE